MSSHGSGTHAQCLPVTTMTGWSFEALQCCGGLCLLEWSQMTSPGWAPQTSSGVMHDMFLLLPFQAFTPYPGLNLLVEILLQTTGISRRCYLFGMYFTSGGNPSGNVITLHKYSSVN